MKQNRKIDCSKGEAPVPCRLSDPLNNSLASRDLFLSVLLLQLEAGSKFETFIG